MVINHLPFRSELPLYVAHPAVEWRHETQPLPIPFLLLAILTLLATLWGGLMRIGRQLSALNPSLALAHGPLMISGFLGTLIMLERAFALKQKWMYIPPLLAGLGGLLTFLIRPLSLWLILLALGSLGGVAIPAEITRHETAFHTLTMLIVQ